MRTKRLVALLLATTLAMAPALAVNADSNSSTSTSSSSNGSSSSSASASASADIKKDGNTTTINTSTSTSTSTSTTERWVERDYGGRWYGGYANGYRYSENGCDYYDDGYYDRNGNWHYYSDGGGRWQNGRWYPNSSYDSGGYFDNNGKWHSYGDSRNNSSTNRSNYTYYVVIDRANNTISAWSNPDGRGNYRDLPFYKYCSTGRNTPSGAATIQSHINNGNMTALTDGTYAKYCITLSNGLSIHSTCYDARGNAYKEDASNIGRTVTSGDIRLLPDDAKWIYQNCVDGTPVYIY